MIATGVICINLPSGPEVPMNKTDNINGKYPAVDKVWNFLNETGYFNYFCQP